MEIKSVLLNSPEFKVLKDSIIWASKEDHKEEWRVKLIEYINMTVDNDDDEFFYDMLEYSQFLKPDNETTAYTSPDKLIFMNAPGVIGENRKHWDFTYCHECLHQLWDTFKVADRIKSEGHEYNHFLLNIASDCVINDYLSGIRKKSMPDGLVTPEYLKEEFGVEYNRKEDTQYSLYLKLLPKAKELEKDQNLQQQCGDDQQGDGQQGGGQQGGGQQGGGQQGGGQQGGGKQGGDQQSNGQQGGGQQGDSKQGNGGGGSSDSSDAKNAQDSANNAKGSADAAQEAADKAKKDGEGGAGKKQDAADKAKKAAKEAQDAADAAKEAEKKGDKKGAKAAANKAKEAEQKAKEAAKEAGANIGNGNGKNGNSGSNDGESANDGTSGNGSGKGTGSHKEMPMTDEDRKNLAKRSQDKIKSYQDKISGVFGDFVKKCKSSVKLEKSGLAIQGQKVMKGWNQKMNSTITSFVKAKVAQTQRIYKRTYQRVKRGSGLIQMGQPIAPGKKIQDNKLTINPVFYIDNSYSMSSGNAIDHVWDAVYIICESLKKQFKSEKVVDSITFKLFAFERDFKEIEYGKRTTANGGTFDFDELLEGILERSKDNLINIIITDGEFNVNENETEKFLKELKGLVIYITNQPNITGSKKVKDISDKHKNQLVFIEADSDFTIKH